MDAAEKRPEALRRSSRIRKRREFLETYRSGRKSFGRYVVVFALPNQGLGPRLGITATRKVGKSNVRNHKKRWVREVFRRLESLDGLDVDLVVNLKREAAETDFASFRADLERTLDKAVSQVRRAREQAR